MKFQRFITLSSQTLVAFTALAGSAASLVWLDWQNAALKASAARCWDETAPLVIVDAGHGGHDGGAVANGIIEKDLALDLARRLKRELVAAGVRVVTTRDSDVFLPLDDRAAFATKHGAAAFVSVHLNTDGEGSAAEGIETYFAESKPLSSRQLASTKTDSVERGSDFAAIVQRSVCATTKAENRGTKARGYAVVTQTACPAILVECGFITSSAEAARMKREAYRDQVAQGIAHGVTLFLQTQIVTPRLIATAK
ncbi:MAG: N-acetylmuramoyl-L-alanine amidase [Verrucomicrobiaceae bacterium]